ncbi:hypothetical protein AB0H57_04840 [Micromonospora sp. NPDC050686]|uniref:hypothetical protein n=1 Tax=Micromonospora sp. NPDC050686 TaxID=3154631 RepID=UPI003407E1AF
MTAFNNHRPPVDNPVENRSAWGRPVRFSGYQLDDVNESAARERHPDTPETVPTLIRL